MKKLSCFVLSVMLILSAGFPGAMAACYPHCLRFDIWQRCYVYEEDRSKDCICVNDNGDEFCDRCSDQLCYTDRDGDGQCDNQKICVRSERKDFETEKVFSEPHGRMGNHHGKGHKHCRQ